MRVMRHPLLLISVGAALWASPALADDALSRFNAVAQRAEAALQRGGPEAAVEIYEEALLEEALGHFHLRLGQLKQDLGQPAEAAFHYQMCGEDDRVDPIDRQLVCGKGLEATTSILTIDGLPEGSTVVLQQPGAFAGPVSTGARVPRGTLTMVVEAPGREAKASTVQVSDAKTVWVAALGPLRKGVGELDETPTRADGGEVNIPDGFISSDPIITEKPPPSSDTPWGIYSTGVTGAALLGAGLYLGVNNQDELDRTRRRQRIGACGEGNCVAELDDAQQSAQIADALWLTGTAVVTAAVIWYLLDD